MKRAIPALLFCLSLLHLHAADEPLIPTALNAILPKIHAGMTIQEVEVALAPAYPNVKGQIFVWSGQTGYIDYKLDERHSLSVSLITRNGNTVVHDEISICLYEPLTQRKLDLRLCDWNKQPDRKPSTK